MAQLEAAPARVSLGSRVFTMDDQHRFARSSWDANPMHTDAVAARRLLNGRPVVHGVNLLLTALELLADARPGAYRHVRADFRQAITVGDQVSFACVHSADATVITASVGAIDCAVFRLSSRPSAITPAIASSVSAPLEHRCVDQLAAPRDVPAGEQIGQGYYVTCDDGASFEHDFPKLVSSLGAPCVAAIARLSYIVGMVSPGLHSMFNSIDVSIETASDASRMCFSLAQFDPRFQLYRIAVASGPVVGELRALRRPAPYAQPSLADVASHVTPGEFAGVSSVVVGGSRGLGELTAKMLAAGGGSVCITYAAGEEDAQRVASEIDVAGGAPCRVHRFDVLEAPSDSVLLELQATDCLYYFATPAIMLNKHSAYDESRHSRFLTFYVRAFHELCQRLQALRTRSIEVFYPSTAFVTTRPRGFTEYAMAKAAAEVMIADINRLRGHARIVAPRLPRLGTDQTNSFVREETPSAIEALLPLVRELCRRARETRIPDATVSA